MAYRGRRCDAYASAEPREGGIRARHGLQAEALTRKGLFAWALGGALLLLPALAARAGSDDLAKAAAWRLGDQLSLAALLYAQGSHEEERFLAANASFLIRGKDPPEDFLLLGAGLSHHPNASDEIFIRYDGAWAEDVQADAISAGGKLPW